MYFVVSFIYIITHAYYVGHSRLSVCLFLFVYPQHKARFPLPELTGDRSGVVMGGGRRGSRHERHFLRDGKLRVVKKLCCVGVLVTIILLLQQTSANVE